MVLLFDVLAFTVSLCFPIYVYFNQYIYLISYATNPLKRLLEVNKDMVEILLVLHVLFTEDSKVEHLLCSTVSFSRAGLFFSDNILRLWLEPVKDDLQHDFAWVADEAECPVVSTQL